MISARSHMSKASIPHGFTSSVTMLLAAGFSLPSFFFLYAARFASRCFAASTSSSSSSLPKRSSSSSSSAAMGAAMGASLGLIVISLFSGPYAAYVLEGSPGRDENSEVYEVMCRYQRKAWGYLAGSGAPLSAL